MNRNLENARDRQNYLHVYGMATRTFITKTFGAPHLPIQEQFRVAIETLIASLALQTSHDEAVDLLTDIVSRFGTYDWFV